MEDPRGGQGKRHPLLSVVLIAILATIGGANGWEDMEVYGQAQAEWLGTFLEFPHGIPKADCYRRLFMRLAPQALQQCFWQWIEDIVTLTGGTVIPIDGKTMRHSYDRIEAQSALHVVSAWASEHRLMLGQVKVDRKSNEITAIPALLKLLDISGCIITIDAIGTQTAIAAQIIAQGGDYILALKENHPTLYQQVNALFEQAKQTEFEGMDVSSDQRVEGGHGRREVRTVWVLSVAALDEALYGQAQWAGLQSIVMVHRRRRLNNGTVSEETQFFLSSLAPEAERIGKAIRLHWGIENQLHWVLDVTFGEDDSRIRKGHGPENMTLLRRMAIGALNQETTSKRSIRQKAKFAAMRPDYMLKVLASAIEQ
ncbi:MAG: ISAs1 family transposase [Okeania sp. SIO3C4]|nr:ISAs1 family transposase [Okeania sp. SIO3C4]